MTYIYRRKCRRCGSEMTLKLRGRPSVVYVAWEEFFDHWERDHGKSKRCLGFQKTQGKG